MAKLLQNGTVVTFDDATDSIRVLPKASILIENGRIVAITENDNDNTSLPANTTVVDVQGKIITPGFINTHTHMWQTVYRSMGPNVTLAEYFSWVSQMSPATALFTAEDIHTSCLEGYMEGLHAGVTSFIEHAHNNWSKEVVEPGLQAAVKSGARVWWCYDVMQRDGFSRSEQWEILEKIGGLVESNSESGSLVQLGLAADGLSGSFRDDPDGHVGHAREMIKKLNMQAITIHHLGGPWPTPNSSPSQLCASGLQNSKVPVIFSHAPFLTDEDQKALRENDLFVSITPESESHYGHGQTTGSQITDKACLGIDTNWTFSGDILSQARFWLQHVRLTNSQDTLVKTGKIPNANPFPVDEAFLLATRQGGRALRRDDIGVIQVGAKADLVVFDGDSPNMLGWSNPVAAVMLHANPGDVEHVLLDGEFRKRDFKLVDDGSPVGWAQVRTKFVEAARRIQSQIADPPSLGEKLWGVREFGDVEKQEDRESEWKCLSKVTYVDPTGTKRSWECIEMRNRSRDMDSLVGVNMVTILDQGASHGPELLLLKQYRPSIDKVAIELPGGMIDAGESPEEAAVRELKEETGYVGVVSSQGNTFFHSPGFSTDNFKLVYLNVDLSLPENQHPQSDLEADEFIERFTIPVATLYADLKRLDSEGFAIEARIASLAEGMEIGRRWRSALGH